MNVEGRPAVHAEIVNAVLDYFEGWFEADAERVERALRPLLCKRSVEEDGETLLTLTADRMVEAARSGAGRDESQDDNAIVISVEDVYGVIANATVSSAVYREYVQLVNTPEGWKVVNTLWTLT
jgi:hypothetical protein